MLLVGLVKDIGSAEIVSELYLSDDEILDYEYSPGEIMHERYLINDYGYLFQKAGIPGFIEPIEPFTLYLRNVE